MPSRTDRGSVEFEFALGVVVVLILLMFVMGVHRIVDAEADVQAAASAAARAASQRGTPAAAAAVARETAAANLSAETSACRDLEVDTMTDRLQPGGSVTVTVRCATDYSDLVLLAVPGSRAFVSTATAVVDTYRGDDA